MKIVLKIIIDVMKLEKNNEHQDYIETNKGIERKRKRERGSTRSTT